jgi:hypothetical protein
MVAREHLNSVTHPLAIAQKSQLAPEPRSPTANSATNTAPEPGAPVGRRFLERILQTELQLAIGQGSTLNLAECTIAEKLVRGRKLRCVKRIEELRAEL